MMRLFSIFTAKTLSSIIENDDIDSFKAIIKNKEIANNIIFSEIAESQLSLIYATCYKGKHRCLCYLLKIGADPDKNSYVPIFKAYCTPLYLAVINNSAYLTRLLILHGANPDFPYKDKNLGPPREAASAEMKEIISSNQAYYSQLQELKKNYNEKKEAADSAYRKCEFPLSSELYTQAYNCCSQMKKIWQMVSETEENPIVKSYYQEKAREQNESMKILKTVSNIDETVSVGSNSSFTTESNVDFISPELR